MQDQGTKVDVVVVGDCVRQQLRSCPLSSMVVIALIIATVYLMAVVHSMWKVTSADRTARVSSWQVVSNLHRLHHLLVIRRQHLPLRQRPFSSPSIRCQTILRPVISTMIGPIHSMVQECGTALTRPNPSFRSLARKQMIFQLCRLMTLEQTLSGGGSILCPIQ